MFKSIYNYIFNYQPITCCGCKEIIYVQNPISNMNYCCHNGCMFKAYDEFNKKN